MMLPLHSLNEPNVKVKWSELIGNYQCFYIFVGFNQGFAF